MYIYTHICMLHRWSHKKQLVEASHIHIYKYVNAHLCIYAHIYTRIHRLSHEEQRLKAAEQLNHQLQTQIAYAHEQQQFGQRAVEQNRR